MKKHGIFLVFPLAGLILSGCTLPSWLDKIIHPNKEQDQQKEDDKKDEEKDDDKPSVVHVSSVTLNTDSISIEEMQSEQLSYTIAPSNANDKEVEWFTEDSSVATVNEGLVYGVAPGTTTITIKTKDGNKTDTCEVEVTAQDIATDTITRTLDFNAQGYTFPKNTPEYITEPFVIDDITFTFSQGEGSNEPVVYRHTDKAEYAIRLYKDNTLLVSSSDYGPMIRKIEFTYGTDSGTNPITSAPEGFDGVDTWTGSAPEVLFTVGGTSGHRKIMEIAVTYDGSEPDPEATINLGVKSISEVRDYIENNPFQLNSFGNGVNEKRVVTIKGFALAKIDLFKYTADFGLEVSKHGKVIMGDSTGYIAAASDTSSQGTCLWGKVGKYANTATAKYTVSGYLSVYLGHPEIMVTNFQWDENLDISINVEDLSEGLVSIT